MQLISALQKPVVEGRMQREWEQARLCIPLAVTCLWKVFTAETSCIYESAVSFKAVVGLSEARSCSVRKHLATWEKVLDVLCPKGDRTVNKS